MGPVKRQRVQVPSQEKYKKSKTEEIKEKVGTNSDNTGESISEGFLAKVKAFILPAGIEKARIEIFRTQIRKNGGQVFSNYDPQHELSHMIVDDKMDIDRLLSILHLDMVPTNILIIKSAWLSACLRSKSLVDHHDFILKIERTKSPPYSQHKYEQPSESTGEENENVSTKTVSERPTNTLLSHSHCYGRPELCTAIINDSDSDYIPSDDENKEEKATFTDFKSRPKKNIPIDKWICAQSSKNVHSNLNKHITDKLEEMVNAYESTNDKWRAFGYQKAIQALRKHPQEISSWEEARALPGVGSKLADKIWEIAESGELRKLNEFNSSEGVQVMKLFTSVWGAGPHTAQGWYSQGFRTIQDLKDKAHLTHQQQVGVRLYDDLLDRMPREEAAEIEEVVKEAAESVQKGIIAQACGSYRRGKATCGDVDILVTHPDGKSHQGVFSKLLTRLKSSGFLTDDLVSAEDAGNQKKYLGVCKLPGANRKHRRIDIIVVPYSEYGCALVYFTGSAHFNRSLRHLCKKRNMSLNEHALKTGVVRKGAEKIHDGTVIPTSTEESVFTALGVPYRPPEERDH